jgi:multisubunit Na+/H+ antiporter MnhB subunit
MSTNALTVLDMMLALLLLVLAVCTLHSRHLRRSVILFVVLGLVTALIWARLKAPDVALAEAAIGSGLTGALLLAALRDRQSGPGGHRTPAPRAWQVTLLSSAIVVLTVAASWAFLDARTEYAGTRLAEAVRGQIEDSGVSNPVTAVLLNFRAYDTLLELAVLLAALLGVTALGPQRAAPHRAGPLVDNLIPWLTPLLILTAGYLLWVGAHAPGGAFQAGALLAAAGVITHLSGRRGLTYPSGIWIRLLVVAGCGIFVLVGLSALPGGGAFLQYPAGWAGKLILLIESFATVSIAATLLLVYLGGRPASWDTRQGARND